MKKAKFALILLMFAVVVVSNGPPAAAGPDMQPMVIFEAAKTLLFKILFMI